MNQKLYEAYDAGKVKLWWCARHNQYWPIGYWVLEGLYRLFPMYKSYSLLFSLIQKF